MNNENITVVIETNNKTKTDERIRKYAYEMKVEHDKKKIEKEKN